MSIDVKPRPSIHDKPNNTQVVQSFSCSTIEDESSEILDVSSNDDLSPEPYPTLNKRDSITPQSYLNNSFHERNIPEEPTHKHHDNTTINKKSWLKKIILLISIVGIPIAAYWWYTATTEKCKLSNLEGKYSEQNPDLWKSLSVNIDIILNQRTKSPFVILFLHENNVKVRTLVTDIVQHTSDCFGNTMAIIELHPLNFTSHDAIDDYGTLIENYKKVIQPNGVVLVTNMNEIPAEAARALHTICDTESPIVKDVIIFLTLVTPNIEGKAIDLAEDELYNLWGPKLQSHDLQALITRVTDNVMVLKS